MRELLIGCALVLTLTGCSGSEPSEAGTGGRSFDGALDDGASCQELFDIRNGLDPKDAAIEEINETLRSIGCYNATSDRTDR